jgi:hypothetical protein
VPQLNHLSRSLVPVQQDRTLIAVIEMSQSCWLVAGIVPGVERHPLKKLEASEEALLGLLRRWEGEAAKAGRTIARITIAFEAGRDGFWLAVAAMEVVHPRLGSEAAVATPATPVPEPRMDVHENARTTRHSRMLMMQRLASGWTSIAVAQAQGVTVRTVRKWRARFAAEGAGSP